MYSRIVFWRDGGYVDVVGVVVHMRVVCGFRSRNMSLNRELV